MPFLISSEISEIIDERIGILRDLNEAKNKAAQLHQHSSQIVQDVAGAETSEQIPAQLTDEGTPPTELAAALTLLQAEFEKINEAQAGIRTYEGQVQREREKRRNLIIGVGVAAMIAIVVLVGVVFSKQKPIPTEQAPTVPPTSAIQQETPKAGGVVRVSSTPTPAKSATTAVQKKSTPTSTPTPTRTPTRRPPTRRPPTRTPTPTPPENTPTPVPALLGCSVTMAGDGVFYRLWNRHNSELGCPQQARQLGADSIIFVEQPFDKGHMFFFSSGSMNFVIVKYGTANSGDTGEGTWQPFDSEPWLGNDENICFEGQGLPHPIYDNFNRVWCAEPNVRDGLGNPRNVDSRVWARETGADIAQHVLAQGFDNGFILRDSDGAAHGLAYVFLWKGTYVREQY